MVSIVNTCGYGEMQQAVDRHFALLKLDEKLTKDKRILIKPNLLMKRTPEEFTTTHPALVLAIIYRLLSLGIPKEQVTIADSPGGPYSPSALKSIYKQSGMWAVAEQTGVNLNLETGFGSVSCPVGIKTRSFSCIDPVRNADVIINAAKLKTHAMTILSGGCKNLFGCVPGLQKPELHFRFPDEVDFANMLLDLSVTVKPTVTFVDAVEAMGGDGPSGGVKVICNRTFASEDVFSLDRVLCHFIGLTPDDVPMVGQAVKRGLCPADITEITVTGDETAAPVFEDFPKPQTHRTTDFAMYVPKVFRPVFHSVRKRLAPRPKIKTKGCIGCGKCAESCPAKTITLVERKAKIDYQRCIGCFCCHEMCPVRTIEIRRFRFFNL